MEKSAPATQTYWFLRDLRLKPTESNALKRAAATQTYRHSRLKPTVIALDSRPKPTGSLLFWRP